MALQEVFGGRRDQIYAVLEEGRFVIELDVF